jgi:hypothetical protein
VALHQFGHALQALRGETDVLGLCRRRSRSDRSGDNENARQDKSRNRGS